MTLMSFFALIPEEVLTNKNIKDCDLRILACIILNWHKTGGGKTTLSDLQRLTGKSKRTIIYSLKRLVEKGVIIKKKNGKSNILIYNLEFKTKIQIADEKIDLNISPSEKRKIINIAKQNNLNELEINMLIDYMKSKKIKDYVRYFSYLARHKNYVLEKKQIESVIVKNADDFNGFQIFLKQKGLKPEIKVLKIPVYYPGAGLKGGEWEFVGVNITKLWKEYANGKRI